MQKNDQGFWMPLMSTRKDETAAWHWNFWNLRKYETPIYFVKQNDTSQTASNSRASQFRISIITAHTKTSNGSESIDHDMNKYVLLGQNYAEPRREWHGNGRRSNTLLFADLSHDFEQLCVLYKSKWIAKPFWPSVAGNNAVFRAAGGAGKESPAATHLRKEAA